jgi:succinate dehydrogenase hydrophobic membrane anchor protein
LRQEAIARGESGFWPWLLQRVTAVLLIYGLVVHLVATHIFAIGEISFDNVQERLQSWFFIITDFLLLASALFHGLNGLRMVLLDYWFAGRSRWALDAVLILVGLGMFAYGTWALLAWIG